MGSLCGHLCRSLWARAAVLEQEHGTPETLDALLRKVVLFPSSPLGIQALPYEMHSE